MLRRSFLLSAAAFTAFPARAASFTSIDLYGPEPRWSHALEHSSGNWLWPGSTLTTSTVQMPFDLGLNIIQAEVLVVLWPLSSASFRMVYFDSGPTNIANIGQWITPPNNPHPVPFRSNITPGMQMLAGRGQVKHLGYQLAGHLRLSRVTLNIVYG